MSQQPEALRLVDDAIECWRINYALDKSPHELAEMWKGGAPIGAVLALKAATDELRRLHAENERLRAALMAFVDVYGVDDVRRWMAVLDQARAALKSDSKPLGGEG